MQRDFQTIVIGGGQAGLSASYFLKRAGHPHVVLERAAQVADAWRNHRWDSFVLNTPNWQSQLAGSAATGANPNGFLGRDDVVSMFERYAHQHKLPIIPNVRVITVRPQQHGDDGYIVDTSSGMYRSQNVVVATGLYQKPRVPGFASRISTTIYQIHSDTYRNPGSLPEGAVLVVGSAQSGAQIAEELYQSGRKVYLSVSRSGRAPRRYRGKDVNDWSNSLGLYERTADQLPSPRAKFASKPHISGKDGGHTLNLHQFAADGVILLGRVAGVDESGSVIRLEKDLHQNLAQADQFEADLIGKVDEYIESRKLDAPEELLPRLTAGFGLPELDSLNLQRAGIGTVIWATGYSFDFSMVRLPVLDSDGYPIQRRGVTEFPGLYFLGLPWLHNAKSGVIFGVSGDARYIATHILHRESIHSLISAEARDIQEVSHEL